MWDLFYYRHRIPSILLLLRGMTNFWRWGGVLDTSSGVFLLFSVSIIEKGKSNWEHGSGCEKLQGYISLFYYFLVKNCGCVRFEGEEILKICVWTVVTQSVLNSYIHVTVVNLLVFTLQSNQKCLRSEYSVNWFSMFTILYADFIRQHTSDWIYRDTFVSHLKWLKRVVLFLIIGTNRGVAKGEMRKQIISSPYSKKGTSEPHHKFRDTLTTTLNHHWSLPPPQSI